MATIWEFKQSNFYLISLLHGLFHFLDDHRQIGRSKALTYLQSQFSLVLWNATRLANFQTRECLQERNSMFIFRENERACSFPPPIKHAISRSCGHQRFEKLQAWMWLQAISNLDHDISSCLTNLDGMRNHQSRQFENCSENSWIDYVTIISAFCSLSLFSIVYRILLTFCTTHLVHPFIYSIHCYLIKVYDIGLGEVFGKLYAVPIRLSHWVNWLKIQPTTTSIPYLI